MDEATSALDAESEAIVQEAGSRFWHALSLGIEKSFLSLIILQKLPNALLTGSRPPCGNKWKQCHGHILKLLPVKTFTTANRVYTAIKVYVLSRWLTDYQGIPSTSKE